jgi:hypothetical protein
MLDLVEKEKEALQDHAYLVRSVSTPMFVCEPDTDIFKLQEKVLLVPK